MQHKLAKPLGIVAGSGVRRRSAGVRRPDRRASLGSLLRSRHPYKDVLRQLVAHLRSRPYTKINRRGQPVLALRHNGEGFHNFHHRFPSDFRNGIRWYHWDPKSAHRHYRKGGPANGSARPAAGSERTAQDGPRRAEARMATAPRKIREAVGSGRRCQPFPERAGAMCRAPGEEPQDCKDTASTSLAREIECGASDAGAGARTGLAAKAALSPASRAARPRDRPVSGSRGRARGAAAGDGGSLRRVAAGPRCAEAGKGFPRRLGVFRGGGRPPRDAGSALRPRPGGGPGRPAREGLDGARAAVALDSALAPTRKRLRVAAPAPPSVPSTRSPQRRRLSGTGSPSRSPARPDRRARLDPKTPTLFVGRLPSASRRVAPDGKVRDSSARADGPGALGMKGRRAPRALWIVSARACRRRIAARGSVSSGTPRHRPADRKYLRRRRNTS